MNTNYFLIQSTNNFKTSAFNRLNSQNFKQQKPNPVLQEDGFEDEFIEGDFTKNLTISALNHWSNSIQIRAKKLYCPPAN
jgi:hypothetical protein